MLLSVILWIGHTGDAKDNGMCASGAWMTAASVAGIANELISYFFIERKMRDLQVDFYEEVLCDTVPTDGNEITTSSENEVDVSEGCVNDNPFDAQVQAFSYLVDERRVSQEMYNYKMWGYIITAGIYTIAWVAALIQIAGSYGSNSAMSCYVEKPSPANGQSNTLKENPLLKIAMAMVQKFIADKIIPKTIAEETYVNNLTSGSFEGPARFFKHKVYQCKREVSCEEDQAGCQSSEEDYKNCMNCMRAERVDRLNSDTADSFDSSICSEKKYQVPFEWMPFIWQFLVGGAPWLPLSKEQHQIN